MDGDKLISTILRHDRKTTSYKLALIRSINDVVLAFPSAGAQRLPVAVPLRLLAEYWLAYYWPFASAQNPIRQGQRRRLRDGWSQDMKFRTALTQFGLMWEKTCTIASVASDGWLAISEFRTPRKRSQYPGEISRAHYTAVKSIAQAIEMPLQYAGPGEWGVFDRPVPLCQVSCDVTAVPGALPDDRCVLVDGELWLAFQRLSLWIEALCVHEWALYTEAVTADSPHPVSRGCAYEMLTARPDNRRPLTWERNRVDILLMEGHEFRCPWTDRVLDLNTAYDLDHIIPVSIVAMNEMWNLVPTHPYFNEHRKRDRLPTIARLEKAKPILGATYSTYETDAPLSSALHEDANLRFAGLAQSDEPFAASVASAVTRLVSVVADARNISRF